MPTVAQQAALDYLLTIFKTYRQLTPTFSVISNHATVPTWNGWQIKPDALLVQINLPGFSPIEFRAGSPMRPQFPQLKSYREADASASTFLSKGKAASNMDVALWLDTYPNAITGTNVPRAAAPATAPNPGTAYEPSAMAKNAAGFASSRVYPSKTLLKYFEFDGQHGALEAYSAFARRADWSVQQKLDLYEASRCAFDRGHAHRPGFEFFRRNLQHPSRRVAGVPTAQPQHLLFPSADIRGDQCGVFSICVERPRGVAELREERQGRTPPIKPIEDAGD